MICILYRFYLQRLFLNIKKLAEASLCSFMEPFGVTCERSGLRFLCLVITEKKEKNSTKDRYNVKKNSRCLVALISILENLWYLCSFSFNNLFLLYK